MTWSIQLHKVNAGDIGPSSSKNNGSNISPLILNDNVLDLGSILIDTFTFRNGGGPENMLPIYSWSDVEHIHNVQG